jgi:hypothetical protein
MDSTDNMTVGEFCEHVVPSKARVFEPEEIKDIVTNAWKFGSLEAWRQSTAQTMEFSKQLKPELDGLRAALDRIRLQR